MKISNYAAVAIPTLCRFEHFKRCIESLMANELATKTDIYISVDYPPNDSYREGYEKICQFLDGGIDRFKNVYIFKQETNLGAGLNSKWVCDKAREKSERFIFSEDDNEFSPNYLEYMNLCLEKYKDDAEVIAISGYNFPIKIGAQDGVFLCDIYFSALGYGSWREKFFDMEDNMTKKWLHDLFINSRYMKLLRANAPNQYGNFVKSYLNYTFPIEDETQAFHIDLTFGLYMFENNLKMVFPSLSKVRNWGYDGSGANCERIDRDSSAINHRNYDFSRQPIDKDETVTSVDEIDVEYKTINSSLDAFFNIPKSELFRTDIAYLCSRIIGVENTRKLFSR